MAEWTNNPPLSAHKRLGWVSSTILNVPLKSKKEKPDQLIPPAPPHSQHKKKIRCPSMGEGAPLSNSTMEDILLWRIASHSISQSWGAAAEWGQQGWCRNDTLTLQTSQTLGLKLCLQLASSAHLCWPAVRSRAHFDGGLMGVQKLQMRESVQANHQTGSLLRSEPCANPVIWCASVRGEGCYYCTPENKAVT